MAENINNSTSIADNSDSTIPAEAAVLQRVIAELAPLSSDARRRLLNTVCTFLGIPPTPSSHIGAGTGSRVALPNSDRPQKAFQFSEDESISIKQFIHDKGPVTDVERVACLAYFLARYRSQPHVKTKDISALNTEAAHRPFSNTAVAVDNATKLGYLVPSIKGSKQISAYGERFVEALPDRDAVKEIMDRARSGRGGKGAKKAIVSGE